ncbi:MAG: ABC transporter substrate-binding protein [Anaerolineae bacterium]|nr:ABC transporter substrate-binding protein [Anaerolineae bacterium]
MPSPKHHLQLLWPILSLFLLATQCHPPPAPPLPTTPTGPAINIALLSPSAGELATFGRLLRNGVIMAFDEWNEQGGVLGRRLEWTNYDTNCNFEAARQATQQAVDEGHQFIIGPLCSEAAIAAAAVAESAGVFMIAPTATHPLVTVNGQGQSRPTVFRASYVWSWQAQAMAHFAHDELKTTKAALLTNPGDDYAASLTDTFAQKFTVLGGDIVHQDAIPPDDATLASMLTAISQAGANIIYLPTEVSTVNRVAGQLNALNLPTELTLLGSDSWDAPELDPAATAGGYFTTHFVLDDNRLALQAWREAYKTRYAVEPDTLAALGYDAASILVLAVQQAGTFEPAIVAKTLAQEEFNGITGPITFNHQHNPVKPVVIVHITRNGISFLTLISP